MNNILNIVNRLGNLSFWTGIGWGIMAVILLSSCHRRDLEEEVPTGDYAKILLLTDWKNLEEVPTGMTAIFFPEDGGLPTTLMTNNISRNVIRLKQGKYKVLVFNQSIYEFGSMSFTNIDYFNTIAANLNPLNGNSTATAADYSWYRDMIGDQNNIPAPVRNQDLTPVRTPEPFNGDRIDYEVTQELCNKQHELEEKYSFDPNENDRIVDTIFSIPPPIPPTMNIKVRVKGLNNCYQVKGYITNMARACLIGPYQADVTPAVQVLGSWAITPNKGDEKNGYVTTKFKTFGVPGLPIVTTDMMHSSRFFEAEYKADRPDVYSRQRKKPTRAISSYDFGDNYLVLDFQLKDGRTRKKFAFRVTDDITYTENQLLLELVLEIDPNDSNEPPVILPDVDDVIGSGGAGFDATVEDWKHEDHNISF